RPCSGTSLGEPLSMRAWKPSGSNVVVGGLTTTLMEPVPVLTLSSLLQATSRATHMTGMATLERDMLEPRIVAGGSGNVLPESPNGNRGRAVGFRCAAPSIPSRAHPWP